MRKLVLFDHISLDGYVAGPEGNIDWIILEDEIFDYAARQTEKADTALYGRVTYQLMQAYWPTAASRPGATKHDIQHSRWYNSVTKLVISRSMRDQQVPDTVFISDDPGARIREIKQREGKNILILGSPSAAHILMQEDLIDDYWLFVNPVVLGVGIPLFKVTHSNLKLRLVQAIVFKSGVVGLHYESLH